MRRLLGRGETPLYGRPGIWEYLMVSYAVCLISGGMLLWISAGYLVGLLSPNQGAASFLAGGLLGFLAWLLEKLTDRSVGIA